MPTLVSWIGLEFGSYSWLMPQDIYCRLEVQSMCWNIYGKHIISSENLKSSVSKLNPLIIQGVIINIPTASIYYEIVDTYT